MGWYEKVAKSPTKGLNIIRESDGFVQVNAEPMSRYGAEVGDGLDSNVVMSPIGWIMRNFTEADPIVERRADMGWEHVPDHDLEQLLSSPNPFYDGDILLKATLVSYCLEGDAYWWKVRDGYRNVVALWYLPHFLVEPKWPQDGSVFISHYEYRPGGKAEMVRIPVADMVHLRNGLDPRNIRKGFSQIKPLLREVYTDEEAANFSASILRNMGVPGGIISPKNGPITSQAEADRLKDYMATFTGDRRGGWMAVGQPTEIHQFGFDPNNLMLGNLRDIAEERVCAALGIPAAVVGFGSGLQQTKVGATMREMRREAWDSCITPMQHTIARQITRQLLPDFQAQTRRFRMRFDNSVFAASQEEEMERAQRVALLTEKGILRVDRAQAMLRLEVDPTRAVYMTDGAQQAVGEPAEEGTGEDGVPDAIAARANGARNGNGA
jgi:HK97 family phage portal protein